MPSFLGSNLFVVCEETPAMASTRLRDELECWGAISELSQTGEKNYIDMEA